MLKLKTFKPRRVLRRRRRPELDVQHDHSRPEHHLARWDGRSAARSATTSSVRASSWKACTAITTRQSSYRPRHQRPDRASIGDGQPALRLHRDGHVVPYIGAGAGVGFVDSNCQMCSTVFAYQGILGVGYNAAPTALQPGRPLLRHDQSDGRRHDLEQQEHQPRCQPQLKFGPSPPPPPPPAPAVAPPSFMVFFDWDRSNLSQQALNTIKQAAAAFKTKGNARITATGHTDTSGPEAYNMALSLRRANAVKDALVREGVPAQAITVIGRGEAACWCRPRDGVREPQNRRVEIVIQ